LPSIADIVLRCREPPLWASKRLLRRSKWHGYSKAET
jgi:hypothetical protein